MQMIVKAELVFDDGSVEQVRLASFEREEADLSVRSLGLTLDDGKQLLRRTQQCLSESQAAAWLKQRSICPCGWSYPHKDSRTISVGTVFGLVKLPSPRWYRCLCEAHFFGRQPTWSPLPERLPQRFTPELELLVAAAAAEQPYARAVESLCAVLPVEDCISISGAKNRVRAVAAELDEAGAEDGYPPRRVRQPPASRRARSMAIDSVSTLYCGDTSTLQRNLEKLVTYLQSNERHLVNYAERYRKGLPISSAPAESAVNQLVSTRMAKRRQMRWSDEGAHALVQVRAAHLNGELVARRVPVPWYRKAVRARPYEDDACYLNY